MAKFLAFKRNTSQVVSVDTVVPALTSIGAAVANADTTTAFPNRTENNICQFKGDYFVLYRSLLNTIRLAAYDGANWNDIPAAEIVVSFPETGTLTPVGLHVVRDRLVIVAAQSDATFQKAIARRSSAGSAVTWDPVVSQALVNPDSPGGTSTVWHSAVWFTTADGIGYYDSENDIMSTMDAGVGAGEKINFGSFSFFDSDLYFVAPTNIPAGAPKLYKLDKSWTTTTPTPTFLDTSVILPGVGAVTIAPDTGNYALFVDKSNNELALFYSGSIQTKVAKIAKSGTSYTVVDATNTVLPIDLRTEQNLGFGIFVDDRRNTNEQFTIIIRFRPSIPVAVLIASWNGSTAMEVLGTLDDSGAGLDLMIPNEERCDFRVFTDNQPSCHIDATSQPFPGRVRIDYTVRDSGSRLINVLFQYSLDCQTWSDMTHGDGDSGIEDLTSTPAGTSYFFHWDAFSDLDSSQDSVDLRAVARISGI